MQEDVDFRNSSHAVVNGSCPFTAACAELRKSTSPFIKDGRYHCWPDYEEADADR